MSTRDKTERKRSERMAMLLGAIVDSSDDGIISKDLDGIITSWNKGAERLFGYTSNEVIGKSITIVIPSDRSDEEPEILRQMQRGERVEHFETIRRCKDGSLLNVSLTISPIKDEQGKIVGASEIARDITQRKRAEVELRHANQDLEQFAYSASHDLQEPLRSIKIDLELLTKCCIGQVDSQGRELLDTVRQSLSRMEMIVHDLLIYAQVTGLYFSEELVDANHALSSAMANLSFAIGESNASVTCNRMPSLPVHSVHLKQLFQNLIGNAIKYRSLKRVPAVQVRVERHGVWWVFSVRDNGIGIPPAHKERVFGLFKRLHTGDQYSGTGIGLALCKRIVERYHGRIWVESEQEQGSTFLFTLPV